MSSISLAHLSNFAGSFSSSLHFLIPLFTSSSCDWSASPFITILSWRELNKARCQLSEEAPVESANRNRTSTALAELDLKVLPNRRSRRIGRSFTKYGALSQNY